MKNTYFDAHIHIQLIKKAPTVLQQAKLTGVGGFICNATCPDDWADVIDMGLKHKDIYPCIGVHPAYVSSLTAEWAGELKGLLVRYPSLMIGEIGLDKLKEDMNKQIAVFKKCLTLGYELNRPCHIHCVRAWDVLLHVFKEQKGKMPPKILLHSHHGDAGLVEKLDQEYNAYFSYSAITIPNNHPKVQACLRATPINKILSESDAPDLMPNPADLPILVEKMAQIKHISTRQMCDACYQNAKQFVQF